jgi:hypothetical protein
MVHELAIANKCLSYFIIRTSCQQVEKLIESPIVFALVAQRIERHTPNVDI